MSCVYQQQTLPIISLPSRRSNLIPPLLRIRRIINRAPKLLPQLLQHALVRHAIDNLVGVLAPLLGAHLVAPRQLLGRAVLLAVDPDHHPLVQVVAPVLQRVRRARVAHAELADVPYFVGGWHLAALGVVVGAVAFAVAGVFVVIVVIVVVIVVFADFVEGVAVVWLALELDLRCGWVAGAVAGIALVAVGMLG
jgi:hypothetical protein